MDNKGFTLIELLAVIIVLAIVSSITIMAVNGSYSNAKVKSERVFINNVTKAVEAYIDEANGKFNWNNTGRYVKYDREKNECTDDDGDCSVRVFKSEFELTKVIDSGYLKEDEIVNPNNDNSCYDDSTMVEVYKDSDYVYCFTVALGCLDKDGKVGVINTCPFKKRYYDFGDDYYFTIDLDDNGNITNPSKITKILDDMPS